MRGTMTERRPGVWRLRVVTGYRDGKPTQASRTVRGTKKKAESALARFVAEVEANDAAKSGSLTFGRFLTERYLPHVEANLSSETHRNYESKVNRRILPELGKIRLDKLTAAHLDAAYVKWRKEGLQSSTVKAHHLLISSALTQAVKWALLPRSVAPLATLPKVPSRRPTLPTQTDISELVKATESSDPVLSAAILLAALTGARRAELLGLRWSDIDRTRMTLTIERAVRRGPGGDRVVGGTKTGRSRKLSIDGVTLAVLDRHKRNCEEWASSGGTTMDPHGYVLTWEPSGKTPANPDVLTTRFKRLAVQTGCPSVRFHDLRHFVATTLLADSFDPAVVAGRLGHASPVTTLRTYAHVLAERDRHASGVMSQTLALTKAV